MEKRHNYAAAGFLLLGIGYLIEVYRGGRSWVCRKALPWRN